MKHNFSGRHKIFTIKGVISILLSLTLILANFGTASADGTTQEPVENTYTIDLEQFGIKNDGSDPEATSNGINSALQYAKSQGYNKVIFPQGTYLISESTPISINFTDMVIDLNGSVFEIKANGNMSYSIFNFATGAENCTLINGTLKGDGADHDFGTNPNAHTGCVGINIGGTVAKPVKNISINQITFTDFPGHAINIPQGNTSQNVTIKGNQFVDNRHDLYIWSGVNVSIEENEFITTESKSKMPSANLSMVTFMNSNENSSFTFKNNDVSDGRVYYANLKNGSTFDISGNTYGGIRVDVGLGITITNDTFINCQIWGTDPAGGTQKGKLLGCRLQRDSYIINAVRYMDLEGCTITLFKGQMIDVNLKNCTISETEIDLSGQAGVEGGTIADSSFRVQTENSNAKFNGSMIQNCQIQYTNPAELTVENCTITMNEKPFVLVTANTKSLTFKNNTVNNTSSYPVFQVNAAAFSDSTECTVVIENNAFTCEGAEHVFDGTNITRGKLIYTGRNNTVAGAEILNPQYYRNNPYVTIIEMDRPSFTTLDLSQYDIDSDGTLSPGETSAGINAELKKASTDGYKKVIFPNDTYVISEETPITIDFSGMVIDLNGSTLQINPNERDDYSIFEFVDGAEEIRLTNGTIKGDRESTTPVNRKYGHGIVLKGGQRIQIDNITVKNATGNGIRIENCKDVQINKCTFIDNGNIQETASPIFAVDFALVEGKSIQNVTLSNSTFTTNAHDLGIKSGTNLVITGNVIAYPGNTSGRSAVRVYGKETVITFKFTGNKISNGNVVYELRETESCEISGNEYKDINVISTRLPENSVITLTNEVFENCAFRPGTNFYNSDGTITLKLDATDKICVRLVNCTFKSSRSDTNALYDAELVDSVIGPISSEMVIRGVNFENSTITGANLKLLRQFKFNDTEIINSSLVFSTNNSNPATKAEFNTCNVTNSQIEFDRMATSSIDVTIADSDIAMTGDDAESLIKINEKTKILVFRNNTVVNQSTKPVFYLVDFSSANNCTVLLENNDFSLTNSKYVFDGENITTGKLTYTGKGNTVIGAAEMLNPQYIGKEKFEITERDAVTPSAITVVNTPPVVRIGKSMELTVNVKDKAGDDIPGERINWSVVPGIGKGTFSSDYSLTDENGNASVTFTPTEATESDQVTVRATVDRAPSLYCTIELFADEIISIVPVQVVTEAGTPPVLPKKVTVKTKQNREMEVDVTWDSIAPEKYAQKGSFVVEGTVEDTDIKAVANVRVKAQNTAVTTLTGPDKALNEEQVELILGLTGVVDITDQDISISYSTSKFEFVDIVPAADGITVEETHYPEEGVIELRITSTVPISGAADVVKLSFKAKAIGRGDIFVTRAELFDGLDKFIATLSNMAITVEANKQDLLNAISNAWDVLENAVEGIDTGMYPEGTKARLQSAIEKAEEISGNTPEDGFTAALEELNLAVELFISCVITDKTGDFNRFSGIDIGDLGMISACYGMKAGDEGWDTVKRMDINKDGEIGYFELVFIAKKLIAR